MIAIPDAENDDRPVMKPWILMAMIDLPAHAFLGAEPQAAHRGTSSLTPDQCAALWFLLVGTIQWGLVALGVWAILRPRQTPPANVHATRDEP